MINLLEYFGGSRSWLQGFMRMVLIGALSFIVATFEDWTGIDTGVDIEPVPTVVVPMVPTETPVPEPTPTDVENGTVPMPTESP